MIDLLLDPDFITRAPRDVAQWAARFQPDALPVLDATAAVIEDYRANEDEVDAHLLAEAVANDPLMTLKLLAHVGRMRRGRGGSDTETVTAALVMLGITPFFRAFEPQRPVSDYLSGRPDAIAGFDAVLERARRAGHFALGFAVHRLDHDAAVIHEAALLHDFAELLLWLRAPDLAQEVARRQAAGPTLRSNEVQREVLNIELQDLQHVLMKSWRLPELLVRITDNHLHNDSAQVRNVLLAIRLARHSARGWDNAALPDDVREIATLLNLGLEPTWALVREIDGD
jgi:HD-like signal output (HDOD) protein